MSKKKQQVDEYGAEDAEKTPFDQDDDELADELEQMAKSLQDMAKNMKKKDGGIQMTKNQILIADGDEGDGINMEASQDILIPKNLSKLISSDLINKIQKRQGGSLKSVRNIDRDQYGDEIEFLQEPQSAKQNDFDDNDKLIDGSPKQNKRRRGRNGKKVAIKSKDDSDDEKMPVNMSIKDIEQKNKYKSRREMEYIDNDSDIGGESDPESKDIMLRSMDGLFLNKISKSEIEMNQANKRFHSYKTLFNNMLNTEEIQTKFPIVSITITYDCNTIIAVTKADNREYNIKMYNINTLEVISELWVGGGPRDFIKLKEVIQNKDGDHYAICYFNDGVFMMKHFGMDSARVQTDMTVQQIQPYEVNINELLGLSNWTTANEGFSDPFITCCFIDNELLFINLFHNYDLISYHFIFNTTSNEIEGDVISHQMDCLKKNFPWKCFHSSEHSEIYSFYRQGDSMVINSEDISDYAFDDVTEFDLGQMYLINQTALMVRSSSQILFFKLKYDRDLKSRQWSEYHQLEISGFIDYTSSEKYKFQIITNEIIQFYTLDEDTLIPELLNVMNNFMGCNQFMLRPRAEICVTYKLNEQVFSVYSPRAKHNFCINVNDSMLEGSIAKELYRMGTFLCSKDDKIIIYDSTSFNEVGEFPIKLLKTSSREPNVILAIISSNDDEYIAVISGKNLIKNEQQANQLFIYKRQGTTVRSKNDTYEQLFRVMLKDMPEFNKISLQFFFVENGGQDLDSLMFAKKNQIFILNFVTLETELVTRFNPALNQQPIYFASDDEQKNFIMASEQECIQYSKNNDKTIKLDEEFEIDEIKCVIFDKDEENFYLLCNKLKEHLGFYVIKIDPENPKLDESSFILKQANKLEIGNSNMVFLKNKLGFNELIISFKTIYINTYTIMCIDTNEVENNNVVYIHESFQLWENEVFGFLTKASNDFIKISLTGIEVISLGLDVKKPFKDNTNINQVLHSLQSQDYLKIDPDNFLFFSCQNESRKEIKIQHQYLQESTDKSAIEQTKYDVLYSLQINHAELKDMLIFKSIYYCETLTDISDMITAQKDISLFYKSYFELDAQNMVSILSFDSKAMEVLLDEENEEFFNSKYPLFYKNQIQKGSPTSNRYFYRNGIENALIKNQINAVDTIIRFVATHQNKFITSFLFEKIMVSLFEKGIDVSPLLADECQIFRYEFIYAEWPQSHDNEDTLSRPYNGTLYNIRQHYRTVFPEEDFEDIFDEDMNLKPSMTSQKLFKIKYTINLLTSLGSYVQEKDGIRVIKNEEIELIDCIKHVSDDALEMLNFVSLIEVLEFKYENFAYSWHFIAFCFHCFAVFIVMEYVYLVYLRNITYDYEKEKFAKNMWSISITLGTFYPIIFQLKAIHKGGRKRISKYLGDGANYADWFYVFGCLVMFRFHYTYNAFDFYSKCIMIGNIYLLTYRTIKFLGIFDSFSTIVTMMFMVVKDLIPFLTVYIIMIAGFSVTFMVLEMGNPLTMASFNDRMAEKFAKTVMKKAKKAKGSKNTAPMIDAGVGLPPEYNIIGPRWGSFADTLRLSIGDFGNSFDKSIYLEPAENYIFWFLWGLIVMVTMIVFMNFIIAEACASYSRVLEKMDAYRAQRKANLIAEAEYMIPHRIMTPDRFPRYIITREVAH